MILETKRLVEKNELGTASAEIDPETAAFLLTFNTKNRNPSRATIRRFARTMTEGRWVPNVAVVSMGSDGALVNGQHTLRAIIESGLPQRVTLQTGQPPEARAVFDTGNKRNLAHVLDMNGISSGVKKSSAANLARQYEAAADGKNTLRSLSTRRVFYDNVEQLEWITEHDGICAEAVSMGVAVYKALGCQMKPSALVAFYMLALLGSADKLDEFHESLLHGTNLASGDPVLTLRNWMMNSERKRDASGKQLATVAKAYDRHQRGQATAVVHLRLDEKLVPVR